MIPRIKIPYAKDAQLIVRPVRVIRFVRHVTLGLVLLVVCVRHVMGSVPSVLSVGMLINVQGATRDSSLIALQRARLHVQESNMVTTVIQIILFALVVILHAPAAQELL